MSRDYHTELLKFLTVNELMETADVFKLAGFEVSECNTITGGQTPENFLTVENFLSALQDLIIDNKVRVLLGLTNYENGAPKLHYTIFKEIPDHAKNRDNTHANQSRKKEYIKQS
jgi:hypothetical protein